VDIKRFDAYFYEQHQIDFSLRWKNAQVKPGPLSDVLYEQCNPENEPYMLVCNRESGSNQYELKIDNPQKIKIIYVGPLTNNIFDWTKLVLQAKQIHTIDTAFVHFAENTLFQKHLPDLYYHLARKSPTEFTRRLPWQVIQYDHS
jgi:hypothetical protein